MKHTILTLACLFVMGLSWNSNAQVVQAGLWTGYLDGVSIHAMIMKDSIMYISTFNGTGRFNTHTQKTTFLCDLGNPNLPNVVNLNKADLDAQGNLWTIHNHQLVRIAPSGAIQILGPEPAYQVQVLRVDNLGRIWVGMVTEPINNPATTECLAMFSNNAWTPVSLGQTRMNVRDIVFNAQNQPLVSASSVYNQSGLFQFNGTSFELIPNSKPAQQIAISTDGSIATCGGAYNGEILRYFHNGTWTEYLAPYSFPVFDAENTLWVTNVFTGSVYKLAADLQLTHTMIENYRYEPDVSHNHLNTGFGIDQTGQVWVARVNGLFLGPQKDLDTMAFIPTGTHLYPDHPYSIAAYRDTVWLANSGGFTRHYQDVWEKLDWTPQGNPIMFYDSIRHGIWTGSDALLDFYQGSNHQQINIQPYVFNNGFSAIIDIKGDASGNIWVMAWPSSLLRYDLNGNWQSFDCGDEMLADLQLTDLSVQGNAAYVRAFAQNPFPPYQYKGSLYKIEGQTVTNLGFSDDFVKSVGEFSVLNDQDIWFNSITSHGLVHYLNGQINFVDETTIGGSLNNRANLLARNDSTLLVLSGTGLYIHKAGAWYHPNIPSDRIWNDDAYTWYLNSDQTLYMAQYPLLSVGPIDDLIDQLDESTTIPPLPEPKTLVYPNPTTAFLSLEKIRTVYGNDCKGQLFYANGQWARDLQAPLPSDIDLSTMPAGFYFLSIQSADGITVKREKVIKE